MNGYNRLINCLQLYQITHIYQNLAVYMPISYYGPFDAIAMETKRSPSFLGQDSFTRTLYENQKKITKYMRLNEIGRAVILMYCQMQNILLAIPSDSNTLKP